GRIERRSHRITGNRRDKVEGAGREFMFVAVDDHARIAFTQMHPDERILSAVAFLHAAAAYYRGLGVAIKRLLTDNGSAFRSKAFRAACAELGILHGVNYPDRSASIMLAGGYGVHFRLMTWSF